MNETLSLYLLTIRGNLAPATIEDASKVHNQTAGAAANIAAAQSLGDVSHMVYVPMEHDGHAKTAGAGEFLIMDLWNNLEGLNNFFADPHVQEGGGMIFSERDALVWAAAQGFASFHLPAPFGKNDRIVTSVRGMLKSEEDAQKVHNATTAKTLGKARQAGMLSHEAYLRLAAPGSPEAMEFFAVDVWTGPEGMGFYEDPEFLAGFDHLFAAEPTTGAWVHPAGQWSEW